MLELGAETAKGVLHVDRTRVVQAETMSKISKIHPPKVFFQGPLQKVAMRSDELPVVLDPIEVGCHCYYWVIGDYALTHY